MERSLTPQFGHYHLLSVLGRGGFADVYLADHAFLHRQVALKRLRERLDDEQMQHFLTGMRVIAQLQHPHIIRILECDIHDGIPFLVMPYAPNGTLRQRYPKGEQLPLDTVIAYTRQVASALDYAHRAGQIHADVKPENMLLDEQNDLLLSDFGLSPFARSASDQSHVVGSITYMAPEQLQGQVVPASDQYALAITVYEWLIGEPPFHGTFAEVATQHALVDPPAPRTQRPDLSRSVEQVILQALAKDPQQRFPSVQDFATSLEYAAVAPSSATSERPVSDRPAIKSTPRRLLLLGLGASTLVAATSVAWSFFAHQIPARVVQPTPGQISTSTIAHATATRGTSGQNSGIPLQGHRNPVTCVAWSPDGMRLASCDSGGTLLIWSQSSGGQLSPIASHQETYTTVDKSGAHTQGNLQVLAWSSNNRSLALGVGDEIHIWDSGEDLFNLSNLSGLGHSVTWSPHGQSVAAAGKNLPQVGQIRPEGVFMVIWDSTSGKQLAGGSQSGNSQGGNSGPTGIAWSPDANKLAWGDDIGVYVVTINADATFEQTGAFSLSANAAHGLVWSPDSKYLATTTVSLPQRIQTWDAHTGQLYLTCQDPGLDIDGVTWSPNGVYLASGHSDGTVRLWDPTSGLNTTTYRGHTVAAHTTAWSPDSTTLASGSDDGTIRIWKIG